MNAAMADSLDEFDPEIAPVRLAARPATLPAEAPVIAGDPEAAAEPGHALAEDVAPRPLEFPRFISHPPTISAEENVSSRLREAAPPAPAPAPMPQPLPAHAVSLRQLELAGVSLDWHECVAIMRGFCAAVILSGDRV